MASVIQHTSSWDVMDLPLWDYITITRAQCTTALNVAQKSLREHHLVQEEVLSTAATNGE